jgi:hypothetical protein
MRPRLAVALALVCSCGRAAPEAPIAPSRGHELPLADGIYVVKDETPGPRPARPGERVVRYDPKTVDALSREVPRFVGIGTDDFVPLATTGDVELGRTDEGKQLMHVALAAEHAKKLEAFTRANTGGRIAIVLGGEVLSVHKVREAIVGGRMQITRCTDRACERIRTKLLETRTSP